MSYKIIFDAVVERDSGQYYGTIRIADIRYEDGSKVKVEKYLEIALLAPASIQTGDVITTPDPWTLFTPSVTSTPNEEQLYDITAKLSVEQPYTIKSLIIKICVTGDLTTEPDRFISSIAITADAE